MRVLGLTLDLAIRVHTPDPSERLVQDLRRFLDERLESVDELLLIELGAIGVVGLVDLLSGVGIAY